MLYDLLGRGQRPWKLRAHFGSYPAGALLDRTGKDPVRAAFFNALKEACFLLQGSSTAIMSMIGAAQEKLWRSVAAGDFSTFSRSSAELFPDAKLAARVAIRYYVRRGAGADGGWDGIECTTRCVELGGAGPRAPLAEAVAESLGLDPAELRRDACRIVVAGVEVPKDAGLQWLAQQVRNPDMFLHVCLELP